jgi:hypothetical protein
MVKVEIEARSPRFQPVELRIVEDLEELEDLDFLEEDLLARERSLAEREARLRREEEARRRQAEADRARRRSDARRNRFGDVDSLDEEGPIEKPTRRTPIVQEDFEEEEDPESDILAEEEKSEDPWRQLDPPPPSAKRQRAQQSVSKPAIAGLSTAGVGLASLVYGLVAHSQFKGHHEEWERIGHQNGGPVSPEAIAFGESTMQPAKKRRNIALGIGTTLVMGGGGITWAVSIRQADPKTPASSRIDDIDDLDLFLPSGLFQIRYSGKW